jgi:hypothetical protein
MLGRVPRKRGAVAQQQCACSLSASQIVSGNWEPASMLVCGYHCDVFAPLPGVGTATKHKQSTSTWRHGMMPHQPHLALPIPPFTLTSLSA